MRIVIAEDSAVIRAGLVEILADRGHETVAAVGDAEALRAAVDEHEPDVAVRRRGRYGRVSTTPIETAVSRTVVATAASDERVASDE